MTALFRRHESAFLSQYAELRERVRAIDRILAGTPGRLKTKCIGNSSQTYRDYYATPQKRVETWVAGASDHDAIESMRARIEAAQWVEQQVIALRKLGFQVADRGAATVLVELHNRDAFAAGLILVGTLAVMAWYNELGIVATTARTLDVDLARHRPLKLATSLSFVSAMQSTGLPFAPVPGFPSHAAASSLKLPGAEGLRVDLLAPGPVLGAPVAIPELAWTAQAVPYYDYLLSRTEMTAVLAGHHCITVRVPDVGRLVWHKMYSSTQRVGERAKQAKDRLQATTLGAAVSEDDPTALIAAFEDAPREMRKQIVPALDSIRLQLAPYPRFLDVLERCR